MSSLPSLTILTPSCDGYSDMWIPFYQALNRFWPDCPFPLKLISNFKEFPPAERALSLALNKLPAVIQVGEDVSWSDNLLLALERIDSDYVLLWLDDLFLARKVSTDHLVDILKRAELEGMNFMSLYGRPAPSGCSFQLYGYEIGQIPSGTLYRTSTVLTVWKTSLLRQLLKPGENAWQFELEGWKRTERFTNFLSVSSPVITHLNGVIKGRWRPSVLKKLQRLNLNVEATSRVVMSRKDELIYRLKVLRSLGLQLVPAHLRDSVRRAFIK